VGLGLETFRQAATLLSTMPGLSDIAASVFVAEIGIDMSRFATLVHLLSWACPCSRNDESAGQRRSTRLRRGGKGLKTTLVQAAWAAVKVKGGCLQAQFHRLRARRGAKKAIIGVAASMLTAAWHMLRDGTEWHDLGAAHFDRADARKKPPTASSAGCSRSATTSKWRLPEQRRFISGQSLQAARPQCPQGGQTTP
jgi:hypothetical protein